MNLFNLDFAKTWQLLFQDPATPIMEGIIDLHHNIFFFLLFKADWIVFCQMDNISLESEHFLLKVFINFIVLFFLTILLRGFIYLFKISLKKIKSKVPFRIIFYLIGFLEATVFSLSFLFNNKIFLAFAIYIMYFIFCLLLEYYDFLNKVSRYVKKEKKKNELFIMISDYLHIAATAICYYVIQNYFGLKFGLTKAFFLAMILSYYDLLNHWLIFTYVIILLNNSFKTDYDRDVYYKERINYRLDHCRYENMSKTAVVVNDFKVIFSGVRNFSFKGIFVTAVNAAKTVGMTATGVVAASTVLTQGRGSAAINREAKEKYDKIDAANEEIRQLATEKGIFNPTYLPHRPAQEPGYSESLVRGISENWNDVSEMCGKVSTGTKNMMQFALSEKKDTGTESEGWGSDFFGS